MQLSELKTFLAIIETGSLVRASEKLNVTQSTVTARLKSLEQELGQTLVNRRKSGASLTAAGVRLSRYASTISDLWQQARSEIALPQGFNSVVNFGCHRDLWHGSGEVLLETIRKSNPDAAVHISIGHNDDIQSWLKDGLSDIALTYGAAPSSDLSTQADSPIRFDPGYVFVEAGEEFGQAHAAAYSDAGTAQISFSSSQHGLDFILTHGGSAYLPLRMVEKAIKAKKLFILTDAPVFTRTACLLCNRTMKKEWLWLDQCIDRLKAQNWQTEFPGI